MQPERGDALQVAYLRIQALFHLHLDASLEMLLTMTLHILAF